MKKFNLLDFAAGEPIRKCVLDKLPAAVQELGFNASAEYEVSRRVFREIEECRKIIADFINADPEEIYFTSGCSEGNSLAIDGFIKAHANVKVISTNIEHSSILLNPMVDPCLTVDHQGYLNDSVLKEQVSKYKNKDLLICIQHANNEIGTMQNIERLSKFKGNGTLLVDAAQTFFKELIDVKKMGIDILTVSGYKFGALQGTGFIYIRKGVDIKPIIYGTQEDGVRGGTYNAIGIWSMGECLRHFDPREKTVCTSKRSWLISELVKNPNIKLVGPWYYRLCNNVMICIKNIKIDSHNLVQMLDDFGGFLVSAGSACHAGSSEMSHVLKALGCSEDDAYLRITINYDTDVNDLQDFINTLNELIQINKV